MRKAIVRDILIVSASTTLIAWAIVTFIMFDPMHLINYFVNLVLESPTSRLEFIAALISKGMVDASVYALWDSVKAAKQ